jgi:2-polyprenyl-3-methyl-5-hydroxy-6-metoxy-1,4-benzoquinol methylase
MIWESTTSRPAANDFDPCESGAVTSIYQFKSFKYSTHQRVLAMLDSERHPLRILDAGTASGYMGAILRSRGHYVAGIDIDGGVASVAQEFYADFCVADLEDFSFDYAQPFDYIVFADVLEHLRDPARVLRASLRALDPAGKVIVSIPNIAHIAIRLMLLAGHFDYMERGILDRTHLRFFTRRSLNALLSECGLLVEDCQSTPLQIQLLWPWTQSRIFAPLHELHNLATSTFKPLLAANFVVKASRAYPVRS